MTGQSPGDDAPAAPNLRVSVAVSSFDRAQRLPLLIAALERQTLPRDSFEVIVVDDGSNDGTSDVLRELAARSSLNVRTIRLEENRGQAYGRNTAWRAARSSVIAFTDDDCAPTPQWLERGLEAMMGAEIVVGRTAPAPDQRGNLGPFSRTIDNNDERFFATCNVFYKREDLERVNGFDEGFVAMAGEDTDLGLRLRDLGRRVVFAPDAIVYHDIRPSSFRASVRETDQWDGIVRVVARHGREARKLMWRRYVWKDSHAFVSAATVGLLLTPLFPPAILLALPYVNFRLRIRPRTRSKVGRFLVFPGTYIIDVLEVYVVTRASVRYRTLVL